VARAARHSRLNPRRAGTQREPTFTPAFTVAFFLLAFTFASAFAPAALSFAVAPTEPLVPTVCWSAFAPIFASAPTRPSAAVAPNPVDAPMS